ncbi:hypothetical protein RRG08_033186 [Elysia crispata]|uniref:Uncharacterized protein n=1 Tax=Elysia crispata TaxID=231223 RepID=A0AAE1BC52_9GAST|nr:hypothetical protein RRG08_033186 [Elysia crispata]
MQCQIDRATKESATRYRCQVRAAAVNRRHTRLRRVTGDTDIADKFRRDLGCYKFDLVKETGLGLLLIRVQRPSLHLPSDLSILLSVISLAPQSPSTLP